MGMLVMAAGIENTKSEVIVLVIAQQNVMLMICFTGTCIYLPGEEISTVDDDCLTLVVTVIFCAVVVEAIIQRQLMPIVVLAFYLHVGSNMW